MHPPYIRAPSKNLAPHLWRLHRLKKSTKGGSTRRGGEEGRGQRWTPRPGGPAGAEASPPLLASPPEARARLCSVKKLHQLRRRGGRKRRRRSGPRRAERRSGRSCFCRGRKRETRGARERRAHRLQPSPPPRPRPRPPRPPARRAGGRRAERFQMWRGGGGGGARGPRRRGGGRWRTCSASCDSTTSRRRGSW